MTKLEDLEVRKLAGKQHGVVSRAQVLRCHLSSQQIGRRLARGEFEALHRGTYRLCGFLASDMQALAAACLAAGPTAVVSHRSAAALWGLAGAHHGRPEVTVVGTVRPKLEGVTVHRADRIDSVDRTSRGGLPVTTVARTLLDYGSVATVEQVEEAMEDAVLRNLVSFRWLLRTLDRLGASGRRGTQTLRALIEARDPALAPPEGALEQKLSRLLRGVQPAPVTQFWLHGKASTRARLDFAWPDRKLGIEADSRRWHAGRLDVQRNSGKANLAVLLGWRVLHFTWFDVHHRRAYVRDTVVQAVL